MKQTRSIRPPGLAPSAPAPVPPATIEPEPEPTPERTRTWTLNDNRRYWHRPLRNGERLEYNTQNDSPSGYRRLYVECNEIHALTLQLASDFDEGKI
jgi:hypothetical protein